MMESDVLDDNLKEQIRGATVISFDVFDTLLRRTHFRPQDIFEGISVGQWPFFKVRRILAEKITRLRYRPQQDVSLAQIYELLECAPQKEIEAELQSLYADPEIQSIYNFAITQNKKVVAVSDMYLPYAVIRRALENAGYKELAALYVSNSVGLTKGSGKLYEHVANDLGVPPGEILHFGDNLISDVVCAKRAGWRAVHLASALHRFSQSSCRQLGAIRVFERSSKSNGTLLMGIARDLLSNEQARGDYWYQLGVLVAGPVANAFADWIAVRHKRERLGSIFCMARDGYLPFQALSTRYPDIPTKYLLLSRRLCVVAGIENLDRDALNLLCAGVNGTTVREFWRRLAIDMPECENELYRRMPPDLEIRHEANRTDLMAFFTDIRKELIPFARQEKARLGRYLLSAGAVSPALPSLLVDVGWNANSQHFLEGTFPSLGKLSGAYLGLTPSAHRNGVTEGFLEDSALGRCCPSLMSCVEIIELLMSAPHQSVQSFRVGSDEAIEPVWETPGVLEGNRIHLTQRIQKGAADFTQRLRDLERSGYPVAIERDFAATLLDSIIMKPSKIDVENLGAIRHAFGLGSSRTERLVPEMSLCRPSELVHDYLLTRNRHLYWPSGFVMTINLHYGPVWAGVSTLLIYFRRLARNSVIRFALRLPKRWFRKQFGGG